MKTVTRKTRTEKTAEMRKEGKALLQKSESLKRRSVSVRKRGEALLNKVDERDDRKYRQCTPAGF